MYDRLASSALLELAPPGAELIAAGKSPGDVDLTQDQTNQVLVDKGRTAECVVRLKGGDPFVFGRGGEEAEALAAAGIPFEVVPGHHQCDRRGRLRGHPGHPPGRVDALHRGHRPRGPGQGHAPTSTGPRWPVPGGTLVILMGAGRIGEIARRLIEGGRAPDTPVAAVRNGTRPDQTTVRATLATIADAGVKAPSAIVVGDVAALDLSWFEARPLFGRDHRGHPRTRAGERAARCGSRSSAPRCSSSRPSRSRPSTFTVPDLARYEWLVFTSANGVRAFFHDGLAAAGLDARALAGVRLAAIGPGTAHALAHSRPAGRPDPRAVRRRVAARGVPAPVDAGRARAAGAGRGRRATSSPTGSPSAATRSTCCPCTARVPATPDPDARARVVEGRFDAVTFTSSSTVDNFCAQVDPRPDPFPLVVSIGPVTSATAVERGLRVDAEAEAHTIDGLVATLLSRFGAAGAG